MYVGRVSLVRTLPVATKASDIALQEDLMKWSKLRVGEIVSMASVMGTQGHNSVEFR